MPKILNSRATIWPNLGAISSTQLMFIASTQRSACYKNQQFSLYIFVGVHSILRVCINGRTFQWFIIRDIERIDALRMSIRVLYGEMPSLAAEFMNKTPSNCYIIKALQSRYHVSSVYSRHLRPRVKVKLSPVPE